MIYQLLLNIEISLSISSGTITAKFKQITKQFINITITEEVAGNPLTTGPYCTATYNNSPLENPKYFTKNGYSYIASVNTNGSINIFLPTGTVFGSNGKQYKCLGVFYNGNSIPVNFSISSIFNVYDTSDRILVVKYEEI